LRTEAKNAKYTLRGSMREVLGAGTNEGESRR